MIMISSKDYFGVDASELKSKKLFLFDMDGTIYEEDVLFDGTIELLNQIVRDGGIYVFITNNSSKSVSDYIAKVNKLGIVADKENFFTSVQATVLLLKEKHPNKVVYCQGTKSLVNELVESGISVVEEVSDAAEVILVGFDTELTSQKLRNTCEMLGKDIPYYATNPDLVCPVNFGYIPDCGSICCMLQNATKRIPIYIGKPMPTMVDVVCQKFNVPKEETVIIGDRLYTDIATGNNAGVASICVLTGEATVQDICEGEVKPKYTFESVRKIFELLTG